MKIAIFYRDIFQSGGVPNEIRDIANTLVELQHAVYLWGQHGQIPDTLHPAVQCSSYHNLAQLTQSLPNWFSSVMPDCLLLVGFFMFENLLVSKVAEKRKIPIILNPLGQITDQVLQGKVFSKNPDVHTLEQSYPQRVKQKEQLTVYSSRIFKKIYINLIGQFIINKSNLIAFFSKYESQQFLQYFHFPKDRFVTLQWGMNAIPQETNQEHYYRDVLGYTDTKANFVYWGRLDWHYKGIDRLLNGVLTYIQDINNQEVPFRIFLMGPDYNGGAEKIRHFVQQNNLQHIVHLHLPGNYPAGSKAPLRDASASIYLSRWDGFPRTLRESTMLGVPVLVSKETHFDELVLEFNSGISLRNADDSLSVSHALAKLSNKNEQQQYRLGAASLVSRLQWKALIQAWIDDCEQCLANIKKTG